MPNNDLTDLLKSSALADPTLGLADSQVLKNAAENLSLGKVVDKVNVDSVEGDMKKNPIANVIQYEGDNDTLVWKHPVEDFNTGTQLIVHESQEALFYMNGEALDTFGPGRHTLNTQNMPLIGKLIKAPFGGKTPFHCEVYFINKTVQPAIKWGTASKFTYTDPEYGFVVNLGANGDMTLRVEDSRKLLTDIVGTTKALSNIEFEQMLRSRLQSQLQSEFISYIKEKGLGVFDIAERITEISEGVHGRLKPYFSEFGVELRHFIIGAFVLPIDDPSYIRFKDLKERKVSEVGEAQLRQQTGLIDQDTEKQKMIMEAEGLAQKRALEGYTYQQERGFDVAEAMASNEAVGQMTNMGLGMGMMTGIGGTVGATVGGMMQNTMGAVMDDGTQRALQPQQMQQATSQTATCAHCGNALPSNAKFCLECGRQVLAENEIVCASCGAKTPKGKFCLECGVPTMKKCPQCDMEVPPGGKFCLECGCKL